MPSTSGCAFNGPLLHSSSVSLQFWTVSSGIWSLSEVEVWVFWYNFLDFGLLYDGKFVVKWGTSISDVY